MLTIKDRSNLHQLNSCFFLLQDTDNWGYGWSTAPTRPSKYRILTKAAFEYDMYSQTYYSTYYLSTCHFNLQRG